MMKPDFKTLHPFLQVLPKEEYTNAILREINQLARFSDAYSTSVTNLYITLGRYIYKKYQVYNIYRNCLLFYFFFILFNYYIYTFALYFLKFLLYSNIFYLNCVYKE